MFVEVLTRLSAIILGTFLIFIIMYTKLKISFFQSVRIVIDIIMTKNDDAVLSETPVSNFLTSLVARREKIKKEWRT